MPHYFDDDWLSKLKEDLNDDQWRLKVSNIKKLIEKIIDYFEHHLFISLDSAKLHPDAIAIAKNKDKAELSKLIQLILGISVNCDDKQLYIQEITKLDLSVQQNLMEAIEQLLHNETAARGDTASLLDSISADSNNPKYLKEQLLKALETVKSLNQKEDELNERNYDLACKLKLNEEERVNLQKEIERLNGRLQAIEQANASNQKNELSEHNHHVIKLKARVDGLEKDLLRSDSQKEELQIKNELMQADLNQLNQVNEELTKKVKEAKLLKDELDVHRHSADKIVKYEERIDTYKKKLEELSDIKKQCRLLEDKNKSLVENNIELEEEIKRMNLLKSQLNDYKKKNQELHQQVIEKTHRCDKNEFDLKKLNEKYDVLLDEKQLLEKEKFELKAQLDTSRSNNLDSNFSLMGEAEASTYTVNKHNLNFEIKSEEVDVKERLLRLELENKHLKTKMAEANQEDLLLTKANYEDAKLRIVELENDNRNLNKKLIESESKLNDLEARSELLNSGQSGSRGQADEGRSVMRDQEHLIQQLKVEIKSLKLKLGQKEHLLSKNEEKIVEVEEKYRKAVDKAKQAFSGLELASLNINGTASLQSNCTQLSDSIINSARADDPNSYTNLSNEQLKQMLMMANQKIVSLYDEYQRYRNSTEFETRMMATAVHGFAFNLMRNSATERLKVGSGALHSLQGQSNNSFYGSTNSNLNSSNLSLNAANSSQSFLTKQRQATSRNRINLEKVSNS